MEAIQTKRVCEAEIVHLLTQVEEGNINALAVYAIFKHSKDLIEEAIKQIEPSVQREAELYSEKSFQESGFTFEKRNGATRYSYNHIPEIQGLKKELKDLEAKYKHAFLSKQRGLLAATEDGEELILPKVSYSKDSLIVKKYESTK